jgi:hypothetical protein
MIGIFSADETRLVQTYNSLTLNNPSDAADNTYEVNVVAAHPQLDSIDDPNPDDDGTEIYRARKIRLVVSIAGTIRSTTIAGMYDKIKALMAAFDPAKASHENPTTQGFLAYDFSTPTLNTTTYPTGLVSCRYYARARTLYVPTISEYSGQSSFFTLELEMADPRRYEQTQATLAGDGTATNRGDYRTWPTLTITCTGAGSATYTTTRTGTGLAATTKALVLDLSTCLNGDVVTVDMANKRIQRTRTAVTTDVPSLYASGVYFELEPVAQTITVTNTSNTTSSHAWRHAYCV